MNIKKAKTTLKATPQHEMDSFLLLLETQAFFAQDFSIFEKAQAKVLSEYGLSASQWIALWALDVYKKPLNATELSRLLPIEAPSISLLLEKMEDRKYITRIRSKADKRIWDITLTPQGHKFVASVYPQVAKLYYSVFSVLSTNEMAAFKQLLLKIRTNMVDVLNLNKSHVDQTMEVYLNLVKEILSEKDIESLLRYISKK